MSASARVVSMALPVALPHDRARDRPGMAFFAEGSDDEGEVAFARARDHVGGVRTVATHAHVERPVEAEREAACGLVELHRRNPEIEHNAIGRGRSDDRFQIGEALFVEFETAGRGIHQSGALRDGAGVAIDADHAGARHLQNGARIAAGAEGRIDIDTAVPDIEPSRGASGEHGDMAR